MGLIGLVIALLMIAHESQNVLRFPFRIGQSPFDQLPGLRQCQGWSFFLNFSRSRTRNNCAKNTSRVCRCQAVQDRCS